MPVFVISRVAADAMVTETEVWSVRVSGWSAASVDSLAGLADAIAVPDRAFDGAALLVSVAQGGIDPVADALLRTGASIRSRALVGSHATRYTVPRNNNFLRPLAGEVANQRVPGRSGRHAGQDQSRLAHEFMQPPLPALGGGGQEDTSE